ncbi:MAG: hypothetical protein E8D45_05155 [Nitrospira sp.]|nr:MAG: hypothetical protein E8D45_05155 [Nitrospira sp.]
MRFLRKAQWTVGALLLLLQWSCSTPSSVIPPATQSTEGVPTSVILQEAVHFTSPDGQDVVAEPGSYRIEPTVEANLRLVPENGRVPLQIAAATNNYELEFAVPVAISLPVDHDTVYVALVLPGGSALDALGSRSGIRERASWTPTRKKQVIRALLSKPSQVPAGLLREP